MLEAAYIIAIVIALTEILKPAIKKVKYFTDNGIDSMVIGLVVVVIGAAINAGNFLYFGPSTDVTTVQQAIGQGIMFSLSAAGAYGITVGSVTKYNEVKSTKV